MNLRHFSRRTIPKKSFVSVFLLALLPCSLLAATDIETGTAGASGGGVGQSASAAAASTDDSNVATATGGAGGSGSIAGGTGGAAVATGSTSASGDSLAYGCATGGAGGDGSSGGSGGTAATTVTANGFNAGLGSVSAAAYATGGNGGIGSGGAQYSGGAGGGATASATGTSTGGGDVTIMANQFGGAGGGVTSGTAVGGAGANSTALNAVSGFTTGALTLTQNAYGGNGGSGNGANGGSGGGGSSTLNLSDTAAIALSISLLGQGGNGGDGHLGGNGADGATGDARLTVAARKDVTATAWATGGNGGDSYGTGAAGAGGSVTGNAVISSSTGTVELDGALVGGNGGSAVNSGTAGAGGNALGTFSGISHGDANSVVVGLLRGVTVIGGAGGSAADVGVGGAGGNATGICTGTAFGNSWVVASNDVWGGQGGASGTGLLCSGGGGAGGLAQSITSAFNAGSESVMAFGNATGGNGGASGQGYGGGAGGRATALAAGASTGGGTVDVAVNQRGGAGGDAGYWVTGTQLGGAGANSLLVNAVSGFTTGQLSLTQNAYGGNGGNGNGQGGVGSSTLVLSDTAASILTVSVLGQGGSGGAGHLGNNGSDGAAGSVWLAASGTGTVNATATARGGNGGLSDGTGNGGAGGNASSAAGLFSTAGFALNASASAYGGPGGSGATGGEGGSATATATGTSLGGASLSISINQYGGDGGGAVSGTANGATGASSVATNAVSGFTSGSLSLGQNAFGGRGGSSNGAGGGTGGAASSILGVTDAVASTLCACVAAQGGDGGSGSYGGNGGNGGTGTALLELSGTGGIVLTQATARGGNGGTACGNTVGSSTDYTGTGNGGDGGAAVLTGVHGLSTLNQSVDLCGTAYGGNGGDALTAGFAGKGADALLSDAVSGSTSRVLSVQQNANGGNGGSGYSVNGGAAGGIGSSTIVLSDTMASSLSVHVSGCGGNGGDGYLGGNGADGAVGVASLTVTGTGTVSACATVRGGNGGTARGNTAIDMADYTGAGIAGNGASVTLGNVLAASIGNGGVTAEAIAIGGNGGDSFTTGSAGNGGSASNGALLISSSTAAVALHGAVTGGTGGSAYGSGAAGFGGSATGTFSASSSNDGNSIWVGTGVGSGDPAVSGGAGGNAVSGPAGAGGSATGLSTGTAVGNSQVTVCNNAFGGAGGSSGDGATAGSGNGIGGAGGAALSNAIGFAAGSLPVAVSANATGGAGGAGAGATSTGGNGGAATAMSGGTATGGGSVWVSASAIAGVAGTDVTSGLSGTAGSATATATAYGTALSGSIGAMATAIGLGGTAAAHAIVAPTALVLAQQVDAIAPVVANDQSIAVAAASIGQSFGGLSTIGGFQAAGVATAFPTSDVVSGAVQGTVNIANVIASGAPNSTLDLMALGVGYSTGSGSGAQVFSTSVTLSVNLSNLTGGGEHVEIGLFDPQSSGAGFDSLTLQVLNGGALVLQQTFSTLSSALAYFSDNTIDAGALATGSSANTATLAVSIAATEHTIGSAFGAEIAVINAVPPVLIDSGTFVVGREQSIAPGAHVTNNGLLLFDSGSALTVTNLISGSGCLVQTSNLLTLSGSNCYSGGNTITGGTLKLGSANALGAVGGSLVLKGAGCTLDLAGYGATVGTVSGSSGALITNSGSGAASLATTVAGGGTSCYSGSIADGVGGVTLTKNGTGTFVLGGSFSFAELDANDGVTELAQSGSIGALDLALGARLVLPAHTGSSYTVLGISSLVRVLTVSSGTVVIGSGLDLGPGPLADNATLLFNSGSALTVANPISGSGALVQSGASLLLLTGSNSYTGGTVLTGGTLRMGNAEALGAAGNPLAAGAGTLDLNGYNPTVGALSGSAGALITNGAAGTSTLTTTVTGGTSAFAGTIGNGVGGVVVTKLGAGTLIFSGSLGIFGLNANGGNTELTQSGTAGALSVAAGSTLTIAAHSGSAREVLDIASLSIAGITAHAGAGNPTPVSASDTAGDLSAGKSDGEVSVGEPNPDAAALVARIVSDHAENFACETIPAADGNDVFEIESCSGTIVLRGNNGVAIASALKRYLADYCHADPGWHCGSQMRLPPTLPSVPAKVRVVSPYRLRYDYNYCTHGYTFAWWGWDKWEREIDDLAMHGINLALVIEGHEQVWIDALSQFGYSGADVCKWLVMPSHQPWQYLSNMQNYGGPVPASMVSGRLELGQEIVARMRALGIEPVLQGYYGIVPSDFHTRFPTAQVHPQGMWSTQQRPDMLDPSDSLFPRFAAAFYAAQTHYFGGASFLAADPFHEGGNTAGIDLPTCARQIRASMDAAYPGVTWVFQGWEGNPRQPMLDALDKSKCLVLDLFCDYQENWRARNEFGGTPWLWCVLENFGGNRGLNSRLDWVGRGAGTALSDPSQRMMAGIGGLMEGSDTIPAVWERFFDNSWQGQSVDLPAWLHQYLSRRYGVASPKAEQAWTILAQTCFNAPSGFDRFPCNSVVCALPSLDPDQPARNTSATKQPYDTAQLVAAWKLLLDAAPACGASDGYRYDAADVGRQVLGDLGTHYHHAILRAFQAKDPVALQELSNSMLGLILDMDELVGTRREFLFGTWIADARAWGRTPQEKSLCEWNARVLLTDWTVPECGADYANREWNGLLGQFYSMRWKMWLQALNAAVGNPGQFDQDSIRTQIQEWEYAWARQTDSFAEQPSGDTLAVCRRLLDKYSADATDPALTQN